MQFAGTLESQRSPFPLNEAFLIWLWAPFLAFLLFVVCRSASATVAARTTGRSTAPTIAVRSAASCSAFAGGTRHAANASWQPARAVHRRRDSESVVFGPNGPEGEEIVWLHICFVLFGLPSFGICPVTSRHQQQEKEMADMVWRQQQWGSKG